MIFEKLPIDWLEILLENYSEEEIINFAKKINNSYETNHICMFIRVQFGL